MVITNSYGITNEKRFCEAYAPTDPIKVIWQKINDAVAYANSGSTQCSSKQVIENTYQIVFNTGIFEANCQ